MCIIINVRHEETNTQIYTYNDYEPEQCRDTSTLKRPAMDQYEDTIRADQSEDGPRSPDADLLWRKIETGDNADNPRHEIHKQETHMTSQPLYKDAQYKQVEHIQTNMQNSGMQENRCDKPPILSRQNEFVLFGSIGDKDISILRIAQDIRYDATKTMRPCLQGYLVGCDTPQGNRAKRDDPGGPGDTRQSMDAILSTQRGPIADLSA